MKYEQNGVTYDATVKDVATRFSKVQSTIRAMAKRGEIPHIRLGKNYLFNMEQARCAIVRDNTVKAAIRPDAYDV